MQCHACYSKPYQWGILLWDTSYSLVSLLQNLLSNGEDILFSDGQRSSLLCEKFHCLWSPETGDVTQSSISGFPQKLMADYFQYLSEWDYWKWSRKTSGCLKCAELIRPLRRCLTSVSWTWGNSRYDGNSISISIWQAKAWFVIAILQQFEMITHSERRRRRSIILDQRLF